MLRAAALYLVILSTAPAARAADSDGNESREDVYGQRAGYTDDVSYEKNSRSHEMVMLDRDRNPDRPLTEIIFDEKLSKEFQQQYAFKFGVTQAEQVLNSPGRYDEYTYNTGKNATLKEYRRDQQKFGEYMARRLIEYHVDNYAKRDRGLRAVYEFKDRVSNLDVKTKNGWKIKYKYNIAGPTMDITVRNPYNVDVKIRFEMTGLISTPTETICQLTYDLSPRWRLSSLIKTTDGIYQLVAARRLTAHLGTSLTGSIDTRPEGPTVQQNLLLVGLSWSE